MENSVNSVKTSFSDQEKEEIKFTDREKEVADLLARGLSEKEIAERLKISPDTVNNHTRNIRKKFGLTKNSEIALKFISDFTGKPFDLKAIREYGIGIFLVLINICEFNKGI